MKKALFFGFAVVLGLILVGTQSNVMACGASNSGSSKMGSTDKVNAVMAGAKTTTDKGNVFACGGSDSGSDKMGNTDKVNAVMADAKTGAQCAAKDNVIKSADKAVDEAENKVKFATAEFSVKGMTCGGCENQVKTTLMNMDGVNDVAKVCHVSEKAVIKYDPAKTNPTDLASAITKLGYNSEYKMASVDETKDKAMDKAMEKVSEIKNTDM